ncbi:hypothetical protein AB4K20DRAFT_1921276 [Rhizopus microsporus]
MQLLSKKHAISCLDMHRRLFLPETIVIPSEYASLCPSVPLNLALTWPEQWPTICSLLYELDQLHHNKLITNRHPHGQRFLVWLNRFL